jgi:hypothetical protein
MNLPLYTREKVLYFASRQIGLHVKQWEFDSHTTLAKLVQVALHEGLLAETQINGEFYYRLTPEGWTAHKAFRADYRSNYMRPNALKDPDFASFPRE